MKTWMIRHKPSDIVVYLGRHRPAVFYPDGTMKAGYGVTLGLGSKQEDYEALEMEFSGHVGDLADGTSKPENYPPEPPPPPDPVEQLNAKLDAMLARIEALEAKETP